MRNLVQSPVGPLRIVPSLAAVRPPVQYVKATIPHEELFTALDALDAVGSQYSLIGYSDSGFRISYSA